MNSIFQNINNLEEFSIIAGNTYILNFNIEDSSGTPIDITGTTPYLKMSMFGHPEYNILNKDGIITGTSRFSVTLENYETKTLFGKYTYQPIVRVFSGEEFGDYQGNIVIIPQSPIDNSTTIDAWQTTGGVVHVGGLKEAEFVLNSTFGNGTLISRVSCFVQNCSVSQIKLSVNTISGGTWVFKVFRWNENTSLFDLVGERNFIPTGTGTQTITLSTPIDVQIGDCPGLYLPSGELIATTLSSGWIIGSRYANGLNITDSFSFSSTTVREINLDCFGNRPYLSVTGDSITMGGNNGTDFWSSIWWKTDGYPTTIPGGEPRSEIVHQIYEKMTFMQYQNQAKGSQGWSWGLSTGVPACIESGSKIIYIAFGINDIAAGRTWANVLADMDAIRVLVPIDTSLFIQEIIPSNNMTNGQSSTCRTWNANYLTWCLANNATLVRCHDGMGKIRTATSQLDDMPYEYTTDGTHLTLAGVQKMSELIYPYL